MGYAVDENVHIPFRSASISQQVFPIGAITTNYLHYYVNVKGLLVLHETPTLVGCSALLLGPLAPDGDASVVIRFTTVKVEVEARVGINPEAAIVAGEVGVDIHVPFVRLAEHVR